MLRARVLAKMSSNAAATAVSRIGHAEAWALEALPAARRAGSELERPVLYGLGWARALRGRPIDDLCERFRAVSDAAYYIADSPDRVAGQRQGWRGDVDGARKTIVRLRSLADERGEGMSYALVRRAPVRGRAAGGRLGGGRRGCSTSGPSAERLLVAPTYSGAARMLAVGRGYPDGGAAVGGDGDRGRRGDRDPLGAARGTAGTRDRRPTRA